MAIGPSHIRPAMTRRRTPRAGLALRRALASPGGLALATSAYIAAALLVDRGADPVGEAAIGAVTWGALLLACRGLDPLDRARVTALVLVATVGEVDVYLAGLRLARSSFVRDHARALTRGTLAVGGAWALAGVTVMTRADVAGALCMSLLAVLILRSRAPTLYACMFACVALLELYGTAVGTWRWAELGPNFALPAGNPPSGIAAGYCLFDALALRLGPRLLRLWRTRLVGVPRRRPGTVATLIPCLPSSSTPPTTRPPTSRRRSSPCARE
jgi:hypothetical protein